MCSNVGFFFGMHRAQSFSGRGGTLTKVKVTDMELYSGQAGWHGLTIIQVPRPHKVTLKSTRLDGIAAL